MEHYYKGKNVEEAFERDKIPIKDIPENFLWMQVKGGSKMNNLLSHATGILKDKTANAVVWTGAGSAIPKVISCAEILKRQFSIKHQVTKLDVKKVEEYWEPKMDGLETIVVKREIPVIHILLSIQEVDASQLGYQTKGNVKFWQQNSSKKLSIKPQFSFKRKPKSTKESS